MADSRTDRHTYLALVADRLQLPGPVAAEVLEELDAHIADSAAALTTEGLTPEQAEREALARLGNPGELGDGIRRAKQTRRRLLVAAGYGVLAAIRGFVWGWLFAGAMTALGSVLAVLIISAVNTNLGTSSSGWSTWGSWANVPYILFALGYAGHRVSTVVAARSLRSTGTIRRPTAMVGAVVVGAITVFGLRVAIDAGTLIALLLSPIAFAVGALVDTDLRVGRSGRILMSARGVVAGVAVATVIFLVTGLATLRVNQPENGQPDFVTPDSFGPFAVDVLPADVGSMSGGSTSGGYVQRSLAFDPAVVPAGWTDFRLEAWLGDGFGNVHPGESGPRSTAPMVSSGDAGFEAELGLPITKEELTYAIAVTGVGPDGRRYVFSGPDTSMAAPWVGTAWEWLTTP